MAYKLEVDHPDFPKDFPFDLDGILVKNKGSRTLTEDEEQAFLAKNRRTVKEVYGHSTIVKITGSTELSSKELKELKEGGES
jgi:hypothetical protein